MWERRGCRKVRSICKARKGSFEHLARYRMKRTCAECEGRKIKIAELEWWEGGDNKGEIDWMREGRAHEMSKKRNCESIKRDDRISIMRKIAEPVQAVSNDRKIKTPVTSNQNARLSLSVIRLMKLMFKVHYGCFVSSSEITHLQKSWRQWQIPR